MAKTPVNEGFPILLFVKTGLTYMSTPSREEQIYKNPLYARSCSCGLMRMERRSAGCEMIKSHLHPNNPLLKGDRCIFGVILELKTFTQDAVIA